MFITIDKISSLYGATQFLDMYLLVSNMLCTVPGSFCFVEHSFVQPVAMGTLSLLFWGRTGLEMQEWLLYHT